ncbi:anthranilate synthase component I [Methylacidimicrobium sp. B4]|uniref:anthranilate synthase component I n=1 Tax=Methylacidimicrobium sp. B4 TaxID=2796139 RepID=UPI001A8ECF89|nr:anthranilate synthase component I [Methylacidimicrobium sp. B4]QSR84239.1 anthranilate synthase component I [Methylacidimicrobium sp. B4]
MATPERKAFLELTKRGNLIPVYREIVADLDTPVSAFAKVGVDRPFGFLLESAEGGRFGRYSFLGVDPLLVVTVRAGRMRIDHRDGRREELGCGEDPLQELQRLMSRFVPVSLEELPLFSGGAVGFLGYEGATYFEPTIPRARLADLGTPDLLFLLADTVMVFDHHERRIKLIAYAWVEEDPDAAYAEAVERIDRMQEALSRGIERPSLLRPEPAVDLPYSANMEPEEYIRMTEKMADYIRAGDIFQVVPSQRLEVKFAGDALDLYRALRLVNPSPYMFCLRLGEFSLVGSSPEIHVRCQEGKALMRPIAGTRPRPEDPREEEAVIEDLLSDPKERAEHIMLLDLARNDLGRVCSYDSVRVADFFSVEKYSHVLHIVSSVEGRLQPGKDSFDVLRATFPAGTVTGAPKVRAMQIIAELEPTERGPYAGVVGYFGFSGALDSCIAIRTVLLQDGKAFLQAGGGLVADSTPWGEYRESLNKAKAGLKALALASSLR